MYDMRLRNPFTMLVAGPSSSGKTTFVAKVAEMRDQLYDQPAGRVYYFYRVWNESFETMNFVHEFVEGMCTMDWLRENINPEANDTVIIDDMAGEVDADTERIFAMGSHHMKTNVILLCQNLFTRNKHFREISINSKYAVIFKNPRDASTITHFARQFRPGPGNSSKVVRIYKQATKHPHTYLLIDFNQATPEKLRIRSNIFGENEEPMHLYVLDEE